VQLAAETSVEDIVSTLSEGAVPRLIVIDSIQTMWTDTVESAPGTVTQVRASAQTLIASQKIRRRDHPGRSCHKGRPDRGTARGRTHGRRGAVVRRRRLAAIPHLARGKNRFGPTDEIGVFEMTGFGLREVSNPSELFLSERDLGSPGTAVFAGSKAPARCWWSCRRWWRRPRSGTPAPSRGRLGSEPAVDGAGGAGGRIAG
jgi:DNA repair protein RadA/Sms